MVRLAGKPSSQSGTGSGALSLDDRPVALRGEPSVQWSSWLRTTRVRLRYDRTEAVYATR